MILLTQSIERTGHVPGKDISIALDIASSEFYDEEKQSYTQSLENKVLSREQFEDMLCELVEKYPIISIEDGMSELD